MLKKCIFCLGCIFAEKDASLIMYLVHLTTESGMHIIDWN